MQQQLWPRSHRRWWNGEVRLKALAAGLWVVVVAGVVAPHLELASGVVRAEVSER